MERLQALLMKGRLGQFSLPAPMLPLARQDAIPKKHARDIVYSSFGVVIVVFDKHPSDVFGVHEKIRFVGSHPEPNHIAEFPGATYE
jgi:hypothetical protein